MYIWNKIDGYKTYLVAIVSVIYAIVGLGFGHNDWTSAVTMILGSSGLGTLRHGVSKVSNLNG